MLKSSAAQSLRLMRRCTRQRPGAVSVVTRALASRRKLQMHVRVADDWHHFKSSPSFHHAGRSRTDSCVDQPPYKLVPAHVRPQQRAQAQNRRLRVKAAAGATVSSETPRKPPTAKQLLLFALPTIILPLADPLMSLIDTVCIGMYGTVIELAATGPASLLIAAPAVLFSAFSATALADISRAQSCGDTRAAGLAFAHALRDAAVAGTAVMLLFGLCSRAIVAALNVSPDVLPHAAAYLAVRALAAPAAMACAVCSVRSPATLRSAAATCAAPSTRHTHDCSSRRLGPSACCLTQTLRASRPRVSTWWEEPLQPHEIDASRLPSAWVAGCRCRGLPVA